MVLSGGANCGECGKPTFPITDDEKNERNFTDKPCCILLLISMVGMGAIYGWSCVKGDTRRLTHGFDHKGRLCGIDPGVEHLPYLYYCGTNEWDGVFPKHLAYESKSCVAECPSDHDSMVPCLTKTFVNFTELGAKPEVSDGSEVDFVETIYMDMTQSITLQRSYPSQKYRGRYCVPQLWDSSKPWNNTVGDELHIKLVDGPLRRVTRFSAAIGSFRHAWWLILIAAVLAVVLGLGYLFILQYYAGIVIYISLWLGTVLFFLLGFFFVIGLFFNPDDEEGWYQNMNPIFRLCYGNEARAWSVCVALIFGASGTCMLFNTLNQNIDESIGVIQAATHCMFSSSVFLTQPILGGVTMISAFVVLFWGYMLASTVQYLDQNLIIINGSWKTRDGQDIDGLQAQWKYEWWWDWCLTFYAFCLLWVMLLLLAIGHFVTAFSVCDYYFATGEAKENDDAKTWKGVIKQATSGKGKHVDNIRVHGVDRVQGGRSGYVEKGPYGKVLVVPVGQPGPDGRDFVRVDEKVLVKNISPIGTISKALTAAFLSHLGSLAMGAWVVTVTSPLRTLSTILKTFIDNSEREHFDKEEKSIFGIIIGGLGLCSSFLDEFFGCFSKNLYSEIVLTSETFMQASGKTADFVAETGGAVALLHGGTALYEMIGVIVITAICSLSTFIVCTHIDVFPEHEVDPLYVTLIVTGIAAFISAGFMSLFNMTCDTLLYVFAWSRSSQHSDHLDTLCPTPLQHIVRGEMDEEPAQALQPHARNKLTRYSHAATKYKDTVMATMGKGIGAMTEKRPLLGSLRGP